MGYDSLGVFHPYNSEVMGPYLQLVGAHFCSQIFFSIILMQIVMKSIRFAESLGENSCVYHGSDGGCFHGRDMPTKNTCGRV